MNFELLSNSVSLWWIPSSGECFKLCILSLTTLGGEYFLYPFVVCCGGELVIS